MTYTGPGEGGTLHTLPPPLLLQDPSFLVLQASPSPEGGGRLGSPLLVLGGTCLILMMRRGLGNDGAGGGAELSPEPPAAI